MKMGDFFRGTAAERVLNLVLIKDRQVQVFSTSFFSFLLVFSLSRSELDSAYSLLIVYSYALIYVGVLTGVFFLNNNKPDGNVRITYLEFFICLAPPVLAALVFDIFTVKELLYFIALTMLMFYRDVGRFVGVNRFERKLTSLITFFLVFCVFLVFLFDGYSFFLIAVTGIFLICLPILLYGNSIHLGLKHTRSKKTLIVGFLSEVPVAVAGFVTFILPSYFVGNHIYAEYRGLSAILAIAGPFSMLLVSHFFEHGTSKSNVLSLIVTILISSLILNDSLRVVLSVTLFLCLVSTYFYSIGKLVLSRKLYMMLTSVQPVVFSVCLNLLTFYNIEISVLVLFQCIAAGALSHIVLAYKLTNFNLRSNT